MLACRLSSNLDRLLNTIRLAGVDLLSGLGDLLKNSLVREGGDDLGGLILEGDFVALNTLKLLEDAVDSARAAAAAHGNAELVGVGVGHCEKWFVVFVNVRLKLKKMAGYQLKMQRVEQGWGPCWKVGIDL
jgi:hypothetical protein